jgi:hypothetical protein
VHLNFIILPRPCPSTSTATPAPVGVRAGVCLCVHQCGRACGARERVPGAGVHCVRGRMRARVLVCAVVYLVGECVCLRACLRSLTCASLLRVRARFTLSGTALSAGCLSLRSALVSLVLMLLTFVPHLVRYYSNSDERYYSMLSVRGSMAPRSETDSTSTLRWVDRF